MAGVLAYGTYLPYHRLQRAEIGAVLGTRRGKGALAGAAHDEDATATAVAAAPRTVRDAAAFLFGEGAPAIAESVAHASVTEEFLDRWRLPDAAASRVWEERFGEHAYVPLAEAAFTDALKQCGLAPADVDVLVAAGTHG